MSGGKVPEVFIHEGVISLIEGAPVVIVRSDLRKMSSVASAVIPPSRADIVISIPESSQIPPDVVWRRKSSAQATSIRH